MRSHCKVRRLKSSLRSTHQIAYQRSSFGTFLRHRHRRGCGVGVAAGAVGVKDVPCRSSTEVVIVSAAVEDLGNAAVDDRAERDSRRWAWLIAARRSLHDIVALDTMIAARNVG